MSSGSRHAAWTEIVKTLSGARASLADHAVAAIRDLLAIACRTLPCAEASLLTPTAGGETLRFLTCATPRPATREALRDIEIPFEGSIAGCVFSSGQPIAIANPTEYYQEVDQRTGSKTKYYVAVPVIGDEEILGVATFFNRPVGSAAEEFDREEIAWCCGFAGILGVALRDHYRGRQLEQLFQTDLAQTISRDLPQLVPPLAPPVSAEGSLPPLARALRLWEQLPGDDQELAARIVEAMVAHRVERAGREPL